MKSRTLYTSLLLLPSCLTAGAQGRLFVCLPGKCHAFHMEHISGSTVSSDSIRLVGQQPYAMAVIDSIVFRQPALPTEERGWQGNMQTGVSHFRTVLKYEQYEFSYDVTFTFSSTDSLCQSAQCKLTFDEAWQKELFLDLSTSGAETHNSPYIYVKGSQTGPRHFEMWIMGDPVLPADCLWDEQPEFPPDDEPERQQLSADCTPLLRNRPMDEVKLLVETWLFEPAEIMDNPDYHETPAP